MLEAVLSLGLSGLFIGVLLAVAANKFKVETNPKIAEIQAVLPGANCGGCGFPGCSGLAEAIAEGAHRRRVHGCGNAVAEKIAAIMGVSGKASSLRWRWSTARATAN
jgi:RnfABCDGE-type electron transport complex B subunit